MTTTTQTWQDRWGEPGRNRWDPDGSLDGHRVRSGFPIVPDSLTDALRAIGELAESDDAGARVRAYEIAHELEKHLVLPDTVWVVFSLYVTGWGGVGHKAVWSAHETEAEAARWRNAWEARWRARGRDDYHTMYAQMPYVAPHYLRREGLPDEEIRLAVQS